MSALLSTAAAAAPIAAMWSVHTAWMRRRLAAARHDPLTGLPTRATFEKDARRLLAGGSCAVVVIDLDGFKALNDTYGHAAGDAAIACIGRRLAERTSSYGLAARLGGDEFALVLPVASHALRLGMSALHARVTAPYEFNGTAMAVGASIGAVATRVGVDLATALRRADEAMYAAKRNGGGWMAADAVTPQPTVNGRRAGRNGTHGGAR